MGWAPMSVERADPRRVVVVLGMHRSGTSLLASIAHALGVALGTNLLAADEHNPAGYWEQKDIFETQEAILDRMGRTWWGPRGSLRYPPRWWERPEVAGLVSRLADIVRREIDATDGVWGFKDPRTSRLLPMWEHIFASLGVEPCYVLAVRAPGAVARSVCRRVVGATPARAELLWLLHNLDAIRDTHGMLRAVIDYDRWFTHPMEQGRALAAAIGLPWPADDAALREEIEGTVRRELRHHDAQETVALPYVAETYALLCEASASGRLPERLSRIDAAVRHAEALLTTWADSLDGLAAEADGDRRRFEAEHARAAAERACLEGQCRRHEAELEDVRRELSLLRSELDTAREEIAAGHARLETAFARLAEGQRALAAAEAEGGRLRDERNRAQELADALQRLRIFRYSKPLRRIWGIWLRLAGNERTS
ncbi:MAG TPA: hypothetical protein VKW76_15075 [Candidatus Binatia bacterium]|nr:hypothetical protein [Candidatus Binatia bacterium]